MHEKIAYQGKFHFYLRICSVFVIDDAVNAGFVAMMLHNRNNESAQSVVVISD